MRINTQNEKTKHKSSTITLIKATAFAIASNQLEAQLYIINILQLIEINFTTIDNFNNIASNLDFSLILEEYHEFIDIFNKKEAYKLPSYRSYDHHISLQEKAILSFDSIYTLIFEELKVLREYINNNLKKQFIHHSQSSYSSSILFIRKIDDILRFYIDY